ncbi:hypothetical protein QBC47DRAFT_404237 [Echria macrotheca]|uniref:Uncharacterized protein n=1 Tax=Echria macrotheca TaxID=438768 RepID=A0AAJ0F984_9PEZI|nr:hypothetical protein QBC47DRAFT_404237 [Echria macrotheca]
MTSAAHHFVALPELVRATIDQIRDRNQLGTLRLVNRTFNEAVKRVLFREIQVNRKGLTQLRREQAVFPHIRKLDFEGCLFSEDGRDNKRLRMLLRRMPMLETFICRSHIEPRSISTLSRHTRVRSVSFNFASMDTAIFGFEDTEWANATAWARQRYYVPDFSGFYGRLEELTLDNLYGDLIQWRTLLVQLFQNSPRMRKLSLSLCPDAILRHSLRGRGSQYQDWFSRLCQEYGETGAAPLPLRSLHCGNFVEPENGSLLRQLIDPAHLEQVFLADRWDAAYEVFANAPRLRRLVVPKYSQALHMAFATMEDPSRARNMAIWTDPNHNVTDHKTTSLLMPDERYPKLPLRLRALQVDVEHVINRKLSKWKEDPDVFQLDIDNVLDPLVTGDDGAIESLMLCFPWIPLGDHLLNGYLELFGRTLSRLTNLTVLYVYVHNNENLNCNRTFKDIAERLAVSIPRLCYIHVTGMTTFWNDWRPWKVTRDGDGEVQLQFVSDEREAEELEMYNLASHCFKRPPSGAF